MRRPLSRLITEVLSVKDGLAEHLSCSLVMSRAILASISAFLSTTYPRPSSNSAIA